ncbi:poly(U)-specific endoribonuclease-A-like [Stylophora pistillata]|uniref:poly(U)-specific endoribonuclease-A-like n=1 Tax=Stylophora pistillata TaxID=50429 RepID=UPI000C045DF8|nr:poly(U)-specific endoribonuclease-A-like [Stylophora pistillata]
MKILVFILLTLPYGARCKLILLDDQACQKMWNEAENNLIFPGELSVEAGNNPMFKVVKGAGAQGNEKLRSEEFTQFRALLVDYQTPNKINQQNIDNFITAVTQPCGPVDAAFNYLKTEPNALPFPMKTLEEFRTTLKSLWFSAADSHGFKHVFVGEQFQHKHPSEIRYRGFHNWYQYYIEEERKGVKILSLPTFVKDKRPNFIKDLKFNWEGKKKQVSTGSPMFVGTSPSFELALFTTCLLKGRGEAGGNPPVGPYRETDCKCKIYVPGIGKSTVEVRTVENKDGKVVTAAPMNVY